jgi:hypothetical protein
MSLNNEKEYEGEEWKLKPLKEAAIPLKGISY